MTKKSTRQAVRCYSYLKYLLIVSGKLMFFFSSTNTFFIKSYWFLFPIRSNIIFTFLNTWVMYWSIRQSPIFQKKGIFGFKRRIFYICCNVHRKDFSIAWRKSAVIWKVENWLTSGFLCKFKSSGKLGKELFACKPCSQKWCIEELAYFLLSLHFCEVVNLAFLLTLFFSEQKLSGKLKICLNGVGDKILLL